MLPPPLNSPPSPTACHRRQMPPFDQSLLYNLLNIPTIGAISPLQQQYRLGITEASSVLTAALAWAVVAVGAGSMTTTAMTMMTMMQ